MIVVLASPAILYYLTRKRGSRQLVSEHYFDISMVSLTGVSDAPNMIIVAPN